MHRLPAFLQKPRPIWIASPLIAVLFASIGAIASAQAPTHPAPNDLDDFVKQAKDYISKENSLTADKMKQTSDVGRLEQERKQLREAMQQARPKAKQGDFFTPERSKVFRSLLAKAMSGTDGLKVKASLNHAEPSAPPSFAVNGEFPNQDGQPIQSVPPTLLQALPSLPKGLEYCIAGKTLALRDSKANMVVDYLPNALP